MSIRLRLALWYTGLAGIVLGAVLVAGFLSHNAALALEVDAQLRGVAQRAATRVLVGGLTGSAADSSLQPVTDFTDAEIWVRYFDDQGREQAESANAAGRPVVFTLLPAEATGRYVDGQDQGERLRGYIQLVGTAAAPRGFLVATTSLAGIDRLNVQFARLLAAISVGGLLLTAGAGWAIAAGALRPISTIITTAQAIALARGFDRRLPATPRHDELGRLTRTLNEMLSSLEATYAAQRRFVDDAAHELRAPLTLIQGNLALLQTPDALNATEHRQVLGELAEEVQRLAGLVNNLLALARADAGQPIRQEVVELDAVVAQAYPRLRALAPPGLVRLRALEPVWVRGDSDRLAELLMILGENAVRYTPAGGQVDLSLARDGATAVLRIADTGIGIAPVDLPHIFERFYRGANARTMRREGTGLGLAIARWIAELHGAALTVESRPGSGTTCTVRFPALPGPAPAPPANSQPILTPLSDSFQEPPVN
ncbi:MAG: HAMP domain-containing histidine kinase [Chloroflexota bacterium]|nr:HAMP domain-containing histidine kinase [Chloroflexota bacterium]